ncbi:MAG: hypothetical protein M3357_17125, partial [Actinomycetota bacterium]|nr:hypothetical protein [Actinomycetota bacterium]
MPGPRRTLRRWGALLALAGVALPGVQAGPRAETAPAVSASPPPAVALPVEELPASLLPEDAWEAAVVEPSPPAAQVEAP